MAELHAIKGHYQSDAMDLLIEASEKDFETVIILGFKDGEVHIQRSAMVSRLALLGALEEAKNHILNSE